jgi:hypothetical protein
VWTNVARVRRTYGPIGRPRSEQGQILHWQALDWTRLDFRARRHKMEEVLTATLAERYGGHRFRNSNALIVKVLGKDSFFVCSAIPGSYSIPEARDRANQLFLGDWRFAPLLLKNDAIGPVHFVARNRSMTESQALIRVRTRSFHSLSYGSLTHISMNS